MRTMRTTDGVVTNDSTKQFLQNYKGELHACIVRVLTVSRAGSDPGVATPARCQRCHDRRPHARRALQASNPWPEKRSAIVLRSQMLPASALNLSCQCCLTLYAGSGTGGSSS